MEEKNTMNKEIVFRKKVWVIDKYNFYEYISVMLDWWVWVTDALKSVESKITSVYFKQKIKELITYISSWDSFSKSMKKIPNVFESSEISIIEAWETTWQLSSSLMKLSDDLKKLHELKNKIKSALTYPLIIFIFLILALVIVLAYVIPAIQPLFIDSDVELPVATKALIWTSDFIIQNYWVLILFFSTVFVLFLIYKNTKSWKESLENFVLNFPLIWKIYKNYILANIAANLSSLVGSWIWIVKSLTLVWKSTNSVVYMWIFDDIISRVSSGDTIVHSIEEIDEDKEYFTADYLQMLSVWEKTASLESICHKINIQYQKEVDYSLARLTKWIEPIAILISWVFILWFSFAIFGAILQVTQTVW